MVFFQVFTFIDSELFRVFVKHVLPRTLKCLAGSAEGLHSFLCVVSLLFVETQAGSVARPSSRHRAASLRVAQFTVSLGL